MFDALIPYSAVMGVIHGANPAMGWLLGVYYGLTHRGLRNLLMAETLIVLGHILSVIAVLGPLYYLLQSLTIPGMVVALAMLSYVVIRIIRKGSHRYLGLKFGLKRLFTIGFILALLHVSSLPLLSAFCLTQPTKLGWLDLATVVAAHSVGAIMSIYVLSTLIYLMGITLVKVMWLNFELVWLAALALTAASLVFGPALV